MIVIVISDTSLKLQAARKKKQFGVSSSLLLFDQDPRYTRALLNPSIAMPRNANNMLKFLL